MVIGRERRGLHDEHVLPADVFLDLDENFHVVEALHHRLDDGHVQVGADALREGTVRVAGNDFHHGAEGFLRVELRGL